MSATGRNIVELLAALAKSPMPLSQARTLHTFTAVAIATEHGLISTVKQYGNASDDPRGLAVTIRDTVAVLTDEGQHAARTGVLPCDVADVVGIDGRCGACGAFERLFYVDVDSCPDPPVCEECHGKITGDGDQAIREKKK